MNLGDLNKVWEIKVLRKPGDDEARRILEKVAKQVQPIMSRRKWRVKLLSEFCPKNPALLGLNVGAGVHIKLRLRRQNREWDFFSFHEILDTMLHELCHNVHAPHDASFYKLWDELRKECEELMTKGIMGTGQGFDLPGRRLGGFSHQPPLPSLRSATATAAEKRARVNTLLPSGPNRLGGDSTIMSALSPIQAAAMAAERRLLDDIWCGSHSDDVLADDEIYSDTLKESVSGGSDANSFPQSSYDQRRPDVVDLTEDASEIRSLKRCKPHDDRSARSKSLPSSSFTDMPKASSSPSSNATLVTEESALWECGACTLLNPPLAPVCELCNSARPKDKLGKYKTWSCRFCTLENDVKLDKCGACGQWRYSYGPPLSTRPPNLGT